LSLWRIDFKRAIRAFYAALADAGPYGTSGLERVEVRGEFRDVYGYHTGGWSGCEEVIRTLREAWPLWGALLERYDRGGHYYFRLPEQFGSRGAEAEA
jgi:hypothetical protein